MSRPGSVSRRSFSPAQKEIIHSAGQGNHLQLCPVSTGAVYRIKPRPSCAGFAPRSKRRGGSQTHHFYENPLPFASKNVTTCKSSWKGSTITSAQLADMINFFLFLLGNLTSHPASSGVAAAWNTRPCFVPALWNAIRSPSAASGSFGWKERWGKKGPPRRPAVCWLWSPGPSFVPPRGPLIRTFALSFGEGGNLTQLVGLSLCAPGRKVFVRNFQWPRHFVSLSLPDDCLN